MSASKFLVVVGAAALIGGCAARSLFPLFTEKELVFNPSLVGTWRFQNGNDTYTFQKSADRSYRVIYHEYGKSSHQKGPESLGDTAIYKVQLGQLGKFWFLDSNPEGRTHDHHMISAHIISKMWLTGDTLHIAPLESDWLSKMIDRGTLKIPHVSKQGDIVLIASTKELQQLVLRFAEDKEAFPNPSMLVRLE